MSKRCDCDLPPPVTRKSSRADLWEALECANKEVDQIHDEVVPLRNRIKELERERSLMRAHINIIEWQLRMVREAVSAKFNENTVA